ncbi:MAG: hypothetical protein KDL87_04195 [Verrucomicrobiae bacterium]|nr:hypothetical protein [Verrucomicrobiae bacterium]
MITSFFFHPRTLVTCLSLIATSVFAQSHYRSENIPMLKSLMLREAPVAYVARLIGDAWGKPIVVNENARDKEISISLDRINCLNALKAICHSNGLWYQEDPESGIIYIETLEDYIKGSRLNNQKQVEVLTVVYPRAEDVAASLQELFQEMVVYMEPEFENGDASEDIERAIDRMSQLASLSTLVDEGGSTNFTGGSRSTSSRRSGTSRGNDRDGIEATSRFQDELDELETRPDQVEASASGEPTRVNPGLVYIAAVRQSNTLLLRSSDPDAISQIKDVVAELDRPQAQVLLEVKVLALDVSDEKQRAIDILFNNEAGDMSAGFANGLANIPVDGQGNLVPNEFGLLGLSETGFDPRSVVFQVIGEEAQARIKLLDSEGKIERLATPNLMVADLEASRIFVGDETSILTDVNVTANTTGGDNPVITTDRDPETERRDIGTTLVITPKIHADNTVTIRVMQENARVGLTKTIVYGDVAQGDFFETTDVQKQTIASTVVAKSGQMVALGGLIHRSKSSDVSSVPVLSDVPVLGKLFFEKKASVDIESELIVLIRPFVMLTPVTAERLSQSHLNRNATHPATLDGSLNTAPDNPTYKENNSTRARLLEERIEVKSTPLDFLDEE